MARWTFYGRVLPERVPITISRSISGELVSDLGFSYRSTIAVHHSQVVARVEVLDGDPSLATLRNTVRDEVRGLSDLFGFHLGLTYDVEIVAATDDGKLDDWNVFGNRNDAVAKASASPSGALEIDLLGAVAADRAARMALADFREAMREAVGTGFFCFRAIEALMQSFRDHSLPDRGAKEQAWLSMNAALNLDASWSRAVQAHATYPRHGRPTTITEDERTEVLLRTQTVIQRYLAYLVPGRRALRLADYPKLRDVDYVGPAA